MERAELVRQLDAVVPGTMHVLRRLRTAQRRFFSRDIVEANRRSVLTSEPWFIDDWRVEDHSVFVRGWAFPPMGWTRAEVPEFTVNGEGVKELSLEPRRDVAHRFWQRENAESSGFRFSATVKKPVYDRRRLELAYLNPAAKLPRNLGHSWFRFDPSLELPMPDEQQRFRVIGNVDADGFLSSGATDYFRLEGALRAYTGRGFESFESILDWGVGCGRLARYAVHYASDRLVGCDIDALNVAWCKNNLPGTYVCSSMHPPLPFHDEKFDLIYGISVFTHLREPLQDSWLHELRRVLRPGGYAAVTIHGRTALEYAGLRPSEYVAMVNAVTSAGLFLVGKNDQLEGAVEGSDEYVNVFHAARYVRKHWKNWLSVVAIIPGYIFTHDLVLLRRE